MIVTQRTTINKRELADFTCAILEFHFQVNLLCLSGLFCQLFSQRTFHQDFLYSLRGVPLKKRPWKQNKKDKLNKGRLIRAVYTQILQRQTTMRRGGRRIALGLAFLEGRRDQQTR